MKPIKISVNAKYIPLFILAVFLLFFGILVNDALLSTIIGLCFWAIGMVYSIKRIKEKFAIFAFNVGFFIFLLGGYSISFFMIGDFSYFSNSYFLCSEEAIKHACSAVMISITTINTTYLMLDKDDNYSIGKDGYQCKNNQFKLENRMRQLIIFIIAVSYICQLLVAIERLVLVRSVTYYASDNYLSSLPSAISYIASLYYITLFVYWATFPKKRALVVSIATLLLLELIIILGGERGEPISILLTIVFYVFLRNRYGLDDIKIPKKAIIILIIIVPLLMYTLQMISYTRDNKTYDGSLKEGITEFLDSQGGSVRIIARAYDLHDTIEEMGGHYFVSGEIRSYFKNNVFTRLILGSSVRLRNVDDAYSGDNFLRTYGYAYASSSYLRGVGGGSTYIAEIFHDGGYLLLFIASLLYAILIRKIDNAKGSSVIRTAILLNIFRYIPLLPRGMALDWLINTFAVQNLILFVLLYFTTVKHVENTNIGGNI